MLLKSIRIILLFLCVVLTLSACTTQLSVVKYGMFDIDNTDEIMNEGAIYYLPKSEFNVTISHVLKECPYIFKDQFNKYQLHLNVDTKAAVVTKPVADLNNAYLIKYRDLESISKEFAFDLQYHSNGMIKSINTNSDDKSADIAVSVAKTAAMIAVLQSVGPAGIIALPDIAKSSSRTDICSDKVKKALANKDNQKDAVDIANSELKLKIAEIKALKKSIEEASGKLPDNADIKQALNELAVSQAKYEKAKEKYDKTIKILTIVQTYKFDAVSQKELSPNEELLKDWINGNKDALTIAKKYLTVEFAIPKLPTSAVVNKAAGIVYRQAATIDVTLCRGGCDNGKVITSERLLLADAGPVAILPFVNQIFQENHFAATFLDTGMIQSVQYSSNAQGAVAAEALGDIANEYVGYKVLLEKLNKADIQANYDKQVGKLDQQIELLKKQKELKNLGENENQELTKLQQELELRKLLSELDLMDTDQAKRELERLTIQQQILELLNNN